MANKMTLGQRLEQLRNARGLTQGDVALALNVDRSTISGWEKGRKNPPIDKLEWLAKLYGVEMWQLFMTDERARSIEQKGGTDAPGEGSVVIDRGSQVKAGQIIGKQEVKTERVTKKIVIPTNDPTKISEEQKARLRVLVEEVVDLEKKTKRNPKEFRAIWRALNGYVKVSTYHLIPREEFERAEKYLLRWKGRLQQPLKRKDADAWRRQRVKAIQTIRSKELGWDEEAHRRELVRLFGVDSLMDLDDDELNAYYLRMNRLKSEKSRKQA